MSYNEEKLQAGIILLSTAKTWVEAKEEWFLFEIRKQPAGKPLVCLCGHSPILNISYFQNTTNNKTTFVGSCCAKRFMGWRPDLIIRGIERLKEDRLNPLNQAAIEFVKEQGWIDDDDYQYLMDTRFKNPDDNMNGALLGVRSNKKVKWRDYLDRRRQINAEVMEQWNWLNDHPGEKRAPKPPWTDNWEQIKAGLNTRATKPASVYKPECEPEWFKQKPIEESNGA